jgi:hypothetical protein
MGKQIATLEKIAKVISDMVEPSRHSMELMEQMESERRQFIAY